MKNPFRRITIKRDLLDSALSAGSKAARKAVVRGNIVEKARQREGVRVKTVGTYLHAAILESVRSFPTEIPQVYKEILLIFAEPEEFTKTLRDMKRAAKKIKQMQIFYLDKLARARHTQDLRLTRMQFYGRVKSIVTKVEKSIEKLSTLLILKKLPDFEDMPTVVIAGLPNVGKTSLMNALAGTKAKVQPYPFTTKGIMLGFINRRKGEIEDSSQPAIQIIDTPGLLDREKHNKVEMQGISVLKCLADIIIYVFDASEIAGSFGQQISLFKQVKKMFGKEIIAVENKTDISSRPIPNIKALPVSCKTGEGLDALKKEIVKKVLESCNR